MTDDAVDAVPTQPSQPPETPAAASPASSAPATLPNGLPRPQRVVVVGAGIVGLSTAWFLQEHGVQVTVLDREGVAAGASWGNAGWLTPVLAAPLPEPAVLQYGLGAVVRPSSPVYVPPSIDPAFWRFAVGFARHSTMAAWSRGTASMVPLNDLALEAFDLLAAGGVDAATPAADPFVAAFVDEAARQGLLDEFEHLAALGQPVDHQVVSGDEARSLVPVLSGAVRTGVLIRGQRYVDPGAYTRALADAVVSRGAKLVDGAAGDVTGIVDVGGSAETYGAGRGVRVVTRTGAHDRDAVIVATGARIGALSKRFGVRKVVQAGRGYSFSVAVDPAVGLPTGPVYLPGQRVACTPVAGRLRMAGMMEFRKPGAALDPRRISAIVEAARPMFRGVDVDDRQDEWVGSRPCPSDGLPLIGATRSPRVFVAGGHGMYGVTLGPATGRALAEQVVTGKRSGILAPFDPLR